MKEEETPYVYLSVFCIEVKKRNLDFEVVSQDAGDKYKKERVRVLNTDECHAESRQVLGEHH